MVERDEAGRFKKRLEIKPNDVVNEVTIEKVDKGTPVQTVEVKPGPITWRDKAKAYYHTIFAAVSAIAIGIVQIAPHIDPALQLLTPDQRSAVTIIIALANAIVIRLKPNQTWVDNS